MAETAIPPDRNPPFVLWEGRLPDGQTTKIAVVPRGRGCTVVWFVGERLELLRDCLRESSDLGDRKLR